jgi:hypothetical protein
VVGKRLENGEWTVALGDGWKKERKAGIETQPVNGKRQSVATRSKAAKPETTGFLLYSPVKLLLCNLGLAACPSAAPSSSLGGGTPIVSVLITAEATLDLLDKMGF